MTQEASAPTRKYSAPALDKGLDIIEYLTESQNPQSLTEISRGLDRSKSEIYRIMNVLEERNIIERSGHKDAFVVTEKLFSLRRRLSYQTQVLAIAAPKMEEFCTETGQSCHIALHTGSEIVVILRVESPVNVSVSIPVGHRRSIVESPSGKTILAFSRALEDLNTLDVSLSKQQKNNLETEISTIKATGYCAMIDGFASGITGIAAPIIDPLNQSCEFALTTTILHVDSDKDREVKNIASVLCRIAKEISEQNFS